MRGYNWGVHIVDTVKSGLLELKTTAKKSYPNGDMNFLVVHFVDMIMSGKFHATEKPTCMYWDDGRVRAAINEIKNNDETFSFTVSSR
ncbi:hypothetical protein LINPERPRIM_LOCUS23684 [Linum perenne]